jgi:hypothetical protein
LPRKSIEPMVLAISGVAPKAVRTMQSCISEGQWNNERLLHQHWQEVEVNLTLQGPDPRRNPQAFPALTDKLKTDGACNISLAPDAVLICNNEANVVLLIKNSVGSI